MTIIRIERSMALGTAEQSEVIQLIAAAATVERGVGMYGAL